jgi:hypothetical protein
MLTWMSAGPASSGPKRLRSGRLHTFLHFLGLGIISPQSAAKGIRASPDSFAALFCGFQLTFDIGQALSERVALRRKARFLRGCVGRDSRSGAAAKAAFAGQSQSKAQPKAGAAAQYGSAEAKASACQRSRAKRTGFISSRHRSPSFLFLTYVTYNSIIPCFRHMSITCLKKAKSARISYQNYPGTYAQNFQKAFGRCVEKHTISDYNGLVCRIAAPLE